MNLNVFLPESLRCLQEGYLIKTEDGICAVYGVESAAEALSEDHKPITIETLEGNRQECGESRGDYVKIELLDDSINLLDARIDGRRLNPSADLANVILYDRGAFAKAERLYSTPESDQFALLKRIVGRRESKGERSEKTLDSKTDALPLRLFEYLSAYSNVSFHVYNTLKLIRLCFQSVATDRRVSVMVRNVLLALLIDVAFGIFVLHKTNNVSPSLIDRVFFGTEAIIRNLQNLLKWLMGSPAGLKLNHAFNTMLGNFFLYHINLWGMFLEISKDGLTIAIRVFQYLGVLGITFQAAIFADLLSLASFHVYCIYIYAARLYNLQLSGLIALWRLFLGRKRNPLRGIVDSCQYNHHQLFIGTLGFTILLFLLPTTLMYYFVFTMFRLMRLTLGGLLTWIQFAIRSFPLYLILLWSVKALSIAGNIAISLHPKYDMKGPVVVLKVDLEAPSLFKLISIHHCDILPMPKKVDFASLLLKICRGKVLNSD